MSMDTDRPRVSTEQNLLVGGMLIGGALIVTGTLVPLARGEALSSTVVPLEQLIHWLLRADPAAMLSAGFLILMAIPVARLLVIAGRFWRQGDRRFALVSLVVLTIVLTGLFLDGH